MSSSRDLVEQQFAAAEQSLLDALAEVEQLAQSRHDAEEVLDQLKLQAEVGKDLVSAAQRWLEQAVVQRDRLAAELDGLARGHREQVDQQGQALEQQLVEARSALLGAQEAQLSAAARLVTAAEQARESAAVGVQRLDESVNLLGQGLRAAQEASLATTHDAVKRLENAAAGLEGSQLLQGLQQLRDDVLSESRTSADTQAGTAQQVLEQLNALERKLTNQQTSAKRNLAAAEQRLDQHLEALDVRLSGLESRLDRLGDSGREIADQLDDLGSRFQEGFAALQSGLAEQVRALADASEGRVQDVVDALPRRSRRRLGAS